MENEIELIADKKDYAVVEKPAGIVVNKADSQGQRITVQSWAEEVLNKIELRKNKDSQDILISEFVSRGGIVHRLDKETSGVLIIAKDPVAFHNLKNQFKQGSILKTYIALAHGHVTPEEGEVVLPIARLPWNRMRFGIIPDGRAAHTKYKVIGYYDLKEGKKTLPLSLLEVYPKTGRTHQIRVHMKALGYPLFSDALYAGRKQAKSDRRLLQRHFLHAASITFTPPGEGEPVTIRSELPNELVNLLAKLERTHS